MDQRRLARMVAERTHALELAVAERQSALEARDVFVSTLAHDLKAPLVSLAWHVQLLRDAESDPTSMQQEIEAVSESTDEAVSAIDELRDLTRLASGARLELHRVPLDLVELVRQVMSSSTATSRHRLQLESSSTDLWLAADSARLRRVFKNLLDNAIKYSPEGGVITVRIDTETVDESTLGVIRIQDQGVGISESDLSHVFERFHRGTNAGLAPDEGIGLASVRELVDLHGGIVEAISHVGVGSTFVMRLPLQSCLRRETDKEARQPSR